MYLLNKSSTVKKEKTQNKTKQQNKTYLPLVLSQMKLALTCYVSKKFQDAH